MIRALVAVTAVLALPTAVATAGASHKGWPKINGDHKSHRGDQNGELRATKVYKHNELLGGHGNDIITAGNVGDSNSGDCKPTGQLEFHFDQLIGGPGKDFIFASHGRNLIR